MKFKSILHEKKIIIERNEAQIRQDWESLRGILKRWSQNPATAKKEIKKWFGNMDGIKSVEDVDKLIKDIKRDVAQKERKWDNIDDMLYQFARTTANELFTVKSKEHEKSELINKRASEIRGNRMVNQAYED